MSENNVLRSCAETVETDVATTTDLRVEVSRWVDPDNGIGAVIYEVGSDPRSPVWEAVEWLTGGDSFALHPPACLEDHVSGLGDVADVTRTIADGVQQLVQVLLWRRGLDPTWPPCPEHQGLHPLRVERGVVAMAVSFGRPIDESGSWARWACPQGTTTIAVGSLHRRDR